MSDIRLSSTIAPSFHDLHKQLKHDTSVGEVWCKGGRGSTKSSFISIQIVLGLIRDPDAHAVIYRRYDNELRDSVFGQIQWAAAKLGVADKFRPMVSPMQALYKPTTQRIIFRGADNPGKARSVNLGHGYIKYAWFEEVHQFGGMDEIRDILQSVFRGGDEQRIAFFSYNPPKSARSWVNQEVRIPKDNRIVHESDYRDVPQEWLGRRFLEEAESLRQRNEAAYRHEYLGEEVGTGLEVFANVHTQKLELDAYDQYRQGLDFGYAVDPVAFERMAYDAKRRTLYVLDEISGIGITNRMLDSQTPAQYKRELTFADSAEPKSIEELRQDYGWKITGVKKGPGSVDHGVQWLQSLDAIVIDPARCPLAAREFTNYSLEQRKDGEVISRYPDKDNHSIDAVRYGMNHDMQSTGAVGRISAGRLGL